MIILRIVQMILLWTTMIWEIAVGCAYVASLFGRRIPLAERIHRELWLFAGPGILITIIQTWNKGGPLIGFIPFEMLSVLWWWLLRNWPNDDDDTWTKRGRRLRGKIKVILRGSRPVVGQGRA